MLAVNIVDVSKLLYIIYIYIYIYIIIKLIIIRTKWNNHYINQSTSNYITHYKNNHKTVPIKLLYSNIGKLYLYNIIIIIIIILIYI